MSSSSRPDAQATPPGETVHSEADASAISAKVARFLPTLFVLGTSLPNLLLAFVAPSILRDMMLPPARPLPLVAQAIAHSPVALLVVAVALPVAALLIAGLVKNPRLVAIVNGGLTLLCILQSIVTFVVLFFAFLAHLGPEPGPISPTGMIRIYDRPAMTQAESVWLDPQS